MKNSIGYIYYSMYCLSTINNRNATPNYILILTLFGIPVSFCVIDILLLTHLAKYIYNNTGKSMVTYLAVCSTVTILGSYKYLEANENKRYIIAYYSEKRMHLRNRDAVVGLTIVVLSIVSFWITIYSFSSLKNLVRFYI